MISSCKCVEYGIWNNKVTVDGYQYRYGTGVDTSQAKGIRVGAYMHAGRSTGAKEALTVRVLWWKSPTKDFL